MGDSQVSTLVECARENIPKEYKIDRKREESILDMWKLKMEMSSRHLEIWI